MGEPKFAIGEKVAIKSILRPDLNVTRTIVTESEYRVDISCGILDFPYTGWVYWVSANKHNWCETALREIPDKPDNSFQGMISRLNRRNLPDSSGVIVVNKPEMEEETSIERG